MEKKLEKFLASPLKKAVNFFERDDSNYFLTEIRPPFKNKDILKTDDQKRVLMIKKDKDLFEIIWSFQYNS